MSECVNPQRIITEKNVINSKYFIGDNVLHALFNTYNCAIIRDGGYVVLDFGRELIGGVIIVTQEASRINAKYRIVFGESAAEAMSDLGEKNSGNYHSIRDMTVDAVYLSTQRFGDTGFRFVKIEAIGADITVRSARAVSEMRNIVQKGSFKCSDELLNEIWKIGAYTVQLNMHEYLWDGIKRDRLVWVGDMHPEVATVSTVFGNDDCVRASLDLIKNETPDGEWMNGIPTYSLWWIIIHYDWYMHWGNIEYLREQLSYMFGLTDLLINWINNGFYGTNTNNLFVDWSSKNRNGEIEGVKSIACIALKYLKKLFQTFEKTTYADKCDNYYKILLNNKSDDAELNNRLSALAVLAERYSEKVLKTVMNTTENEMSCFMGYYILKALSKTTNHEKALSLIRKYWGSMIEFGATSFWEEFKMEWTENSARIDEIASGGKKNIHGDFGEFCYKQYRLSLCHGWASGPTSFLSEEIGGIEILEPGCRKLKISPNLAGLEWIDIEYPTPYGNVRIQSRNEKGLVKTKISAPDEIKIIQ